MAPWIIAEVQALEVLAVAVICATVSVAPHLPQSGWWLYSDAQRSTSSEVVVAFPVDLISLWSHLQVILPDVDDVECLVYMKPLWISFRCPRSPTVNRCAFYAEILMF